MPRFITKGDKVVRAYLSSESDLALYLVVENENGKDEPIVIAYIDEDTGVLNRVGALQRQRDLLRKYGIAMNSNGKIKMDNE